MHVVDRVAEFAHVPMLFWIVDVCPSLPTLSRHIKNSSHTGKRTSRAVRLLDAIKQREREKSNASPLAKSSELKGQHDRPGCRWQSAVCNNDISLSGCDQERSYMRFMFYAECAMDVFAKRGVINNCSRSGSSGASTPLPPLGSPHPPFREQNRPEAAQDLLFPRKGFREMTAPNRPPLRPSPT